MPTENRSSSTELPQVEAAGAAMTQIRTMLGREQRPAQVAAALEACDWSDTPIGNKAIILSAIRALRTKQPHHEPIAWMVGTAFWWTKEEAERDAAATGLPMIPFGPLTGSAEIEQLREVIKHSDAQIMRQSMRISNQRAQLAERDALLRDNSGKLIRMAAHLISAPLFALQDLQDEDKKMTRARVNSAVDVADARLKDAAYELRRIADALSASADPKVAS